MALKSYVECLHNVSLLGIGIRILANVIMLPSKVRILVVIRIIVAMRFTQNSNYTATHAGRSNRRRVARHDTPAPI